jgi:hypothetical protein
MDWSWGTQLLLACGLLFVLVGVLWPKLRPEDAARQEVRSVPVLSASVLPLTKPQLRYAEQVRKSYKNLFGRWMTRSTPDSAAKRTEANQRKAA